MTQNYIIEDIDQFTQSVRLIVFNAFGKTEETNNETNPADLLISQSPKDQDELDSVLTQKESLVIVQQHAKKQINKITQETRFVINEESFSAILEDLNARLVSNILVSLNEKGLIESAYDEDLNDFVFWIKDENKKDET